MKQFFSFPSIDQFRNVVRDVKHRNAYLGMDEAGNTLMDRNKKSPTLKFSGTVKLHGTNAAVCKFQDAVWCQSRSNIITPESDNAGFATFIHGIHEKESAISGLFEKVVEVTSGTEYEVAAEDVIAIYGEWCGGNIQKGVAITGLPKMFVIFKIKIIKNGNSDTAKWLPVEMVSEVSNKEKNIFNILGFKTYEQDIDFESPQMVQNKLIEYTENVEVECPVGKAFGVDAGVGEGIVWTCVTPASEVGFVTDDLIFKVKGEKHSVSKVKKLAEVDIEKLNSITEFIDAVVTENRLNQGIDYLKMNALELDMKNMGAFLKWVANDVFKEEMDTMVGNGLNQKEVGSSLAKKARVWFSEKMNTFS